MRAVGVSRGDGCGSEASRGGRDDERNDAAAVARVGRDGRSARESTMLEDMEIDEVHAIDVRSCVCVLMTKSCTGFTVLNPAYQNPNRRGRAGVTHGDRDDRGWKGCQFYGSSPFEVVFWGTPVTWGETRSCNVHVKTINCLRDIVIINCRTRSTLRALFRMAVPPVLSSTSAEYSLQEV